MCSLAAYDLKWSKNDLRVCFATSATQSNLWIDEYFKVTPNDMLEYTSEEKQAIQTALSDNYRMGTVGFTFSGFKNCVDDPQADIYTLKFASHADEAQGGWASWVGDATSKLCSNADCSEGEVVPRRTLKTPYVAMNVVPVPDRKTTDLQRLWLLALHEFGHIAGLMHEHIRPERKSDPNCQSWVERLYEPKIPKNASIFGAYDSNSVMSYCYVWTINGKSGIDLITRPGEALPISLTDPSIFTQGLEGEQLHTNISLQLSHGDQETLRCMYVYKGEEFNTKCKSP